MANNYLLDEALKLWLNDAIARDRNKSAVARGMGMKHQQLHHWLSGRSAVPLAKLQTIAVYFHFKDDAELVSEIRRVYPAPRLAADGDSTPELPGALRELFSEFLDWREANDASVSSRRKATRRPAAHRAKGKRVASR